MEPETKVVESPETATAQPVVTSENDYETTIASLKAREAKLVEERDNYKVGMLKYKAKAREELSDDEDSERIKIAAKEALAESQLAEIARELDDINRKALKENKELKLALQNRTNTTPAAAMGTHSESTPVKDTIITPEQMAYFKQRGWSDTDIERYKKNLSKRV